MICPNAHPITVYRDLPKEYSWGTSLKKQVVGCKKDNERCSITCSEHLFYTNKIKIKGNRYIGYKLEEIDE